MGRPEAAIEIIPVKIISDRKASTTAGEIRIQKWNPSERTRRAIQKWGLVWGVGLVCVFLPLLHFILVPLCILIGPFAGYWFYKREKSFLGGTARCPECGKDFSLSKSLKLPMRDVCSECRASVKVEEVSQADAS